MEQKAIQALIAWRFCADPGDQVASTLVGLEGIVGALEWVRSKDSIIAMAKRLAAHLDDGHRLDTQLRAFRTRDDPARVETSWKVQQRLPITMVAPGDAAWPEGLDDLGPYAPLGLWLRGNPELLVDASPTLAVVGSRAATAQGLANTKAIVEGPWCEDVAIISGGARGIDTAAHRSALDHQRPSLAVLAGGLESVYPSENTHLMANVAKTGVVISESPCTTAPRGELFLHRNRLIAALCEAVVVVEARFRSGALNTASHASALGRSVAVAPGRWGDAQTAGCFRLVRERGAIVLSEPADIAMLLSPRLRDGPG